MTLHSLEQFKIVYDIFWIGPKIEHIDEKLSILTLWLTLVMQRICWLNADEEIRFNLDEIQNI